jgi:membrane fusion protein (multidrug efflux system)
MNRKVVIAISVVLILLLTGFLSSFFISQKTLPPQRPVAEVKNYVKVKTVAYQSMPVEMEAYGRVGSSQQLNVVAEVGGRLNQGAINLKEGENFSRGQVLAYINNEEQKLTLQSRKSNYLNLVATVLPDIKIDYPKSFQAWMIYYDNIDLNKELPELPESLSTKEKAFLATRGILAEYYSIKSLESNLRKYTIYAPYNGSIQSVSTEVGSVVNPGTNIATILRTDRLELKVPMELKDVDYIKMGSPVSIVQEGANAKTWKGKVIRKADFVDANTQSIAIYIAIESPNNDVYDGQYLKAVLAGKEVSSGMAIERSILRNKNEVFIVEGGRLVSKEINIEKITQGQVIFNGLKEGDMLVVEAPSNASNNMKVEIVK